jgi:hypothetical protein
LADEGDTWVPLRQGVAEVSDIYHSALRGDYGHARDQAIQAIERSLKFELCSSRAAIWAVHVARGDRIVLDSSAKSDGPVIHGSFWRAFSKVTTIYADWVAGDFNAFGKRGASSTWVIYAQGVEIERCNLPLVGSPNREAATFRLSELTSERRGRPRKWDWEGAMCAVIAQANMPDGLADGYGAQAEVGRLLAQWFRDNQCGEPAPSEIGLRAAKIMAAIGLGRK